LPKLVLRAARGIFSVSHFKVLQRRCKLKSLVHFLSTEKERAPQAFCSLNQSVNFVAMPLDEVCLIRAHIPHVTLTGHALQFGERRTTARKLPAAKNTMKRRPAPV